MDATTAIVTLEKLVRYLANLNVNDKNIMMSNEDIVSELNEEIIKGLKHYKDKGYDDENMTNILKRMCYNRISELRYRYYITGRKQEVSSLSLSMEFELEITTDEGNPERLFDSSLRVANTSFLLKTPEARKVFETVIINKEFSVGSDETDKVYNHLRVEDIAAVTGLTLREAAAGIREIKQVYSKVVSDDKN